jgi:hypothetical protein
MWRWIKRIFRRNVSEPMNNYGSHGSDLPAFKPRWGIIIPHTKRAGGAYSKTHHIDEYHYALDMFPSSGISYETRDAGGVSGAASRLRKRGFNASLEPHLNSFNGQVQGAEILVLKGDKLSKRFAELFLDVYKAKYPGKNIRGVKQMKKGQRGAANLIAAKRAGMEVALLSEMFFLDSEWITPDEMAQFWADNLK